MKQLDPRTLLWLVALISTITVLTRSLLIQGLVLLALLLLFSIFKLSIKRGFARLRKMLPILVFVVLAQSIFTVGEPLFVINGFTLISKQGLLAGGLTMFRLLIIASSALLFTLSCESDMIYALTLLKVPDEIAFMTTIALRFLPDYVKEFQLCLESFELRGVNIQKAPLKQKAMMMQTFVTPVLIRSILKAKRLAMAMELKGFKAQPTRTSIHQLKLKKHDYVFMFFSGIVALLLLITEVSL